MRGARSRTAGSSTRMRTTTATRSSSGSGTSGARIGLRTRGSCRRSSCTPRRPSSPRSADGSRSWTASATCGRSRSASPSRTTSRGPSWRSCRGITATSAVSRTSSTRTAKASGLCVSLQLGRDPDRFAGVKAKSYFTYGKIVYKPGQYILRGRLHLDRGHFAFRESDFAGLAELSRLSTLTPQEQARLTPGTAFSAMQVNQAYHDGCLVVWKKNRPEDFKDAENLLRGDRGGFTFEPEVGVHAGLYELDFSSLYPSIMVKYNISAETLDCACCPTDGLAVPELRYHLCTRRVGIVGRVLKPLIERRRYYKKMKKEPGPLQDVYTGRDTILKWTLVTCFSADTLVPYKLNGEYYTDRIENVVNRYLPNRTGTVECKEELRVFGFDNHLHPEEKRVVKVKIGRASCRERV